MADYQVGISGSTTLLIRDTGGWVEFWVRTGSQTWNNAQQWSYFANGGESGVRTFRMLAGGGWQHFGSVYVGSDQDVRFTIYNSGLGFPTYDFWQHITRSTVPAPPYIWNTIALSASHIRVEFVDGYAGGSAIVERQIGYGTNPNGPEYYSDSDGSTDLGPFTSGQRLYFWARTRNSLGWSNWSNRTDKAPWRIPDAPHPVWVDQVTQTTAWTRFDDRNDGGTDILERQLGYGQSSTTPSLFANDISGVNELSDLEPGKRYYYWGRVRNAVGWSPWSERRDAYMIAGARIYTDNQWKRAVPYVRVGGIWKVARPWVRSAGVWKETSL